MSLSDVPSVWFYMPTVCVWIKMVIICLTPLLLPILGTVAFTAKLNVSLPTQECNTLPDKCFQVTSMTSVVMPVKKGKVAVNIWGVGRNGIFADNDTVSSGVLLG